MMTRTLLSAAAIALAAACSPGNPETGAAGSGATDTTMGGEAAHNATYDSATGGAAGGMATGALDDSAILARISSTDEAEIREAQMVQRSGANAQVKAFARKLEADHQAHLKKGMSLAQELGTAPDAAVRADAAKDHADMADDLAGLRAVEELTRHDRGRVADEDDVRDRGADLDDPPDERAARADHDLAHREAVVRAPVDDDCAARLRESIALFVQLDEPGMVTHD